MKNMTEAKISAKNNADKNFTSRFHIQLEWQLREDHAELLGFLFLEMNRVNYVLVSDNFVILFYKTMVITYHSIIILWYPLFYKTV